METQLKFIFEQIASVARTVDKFFFERIAQAVRTDNNFFKRISQAVGTDDNFFQTDILSRSNGCHFDNFFQTDSPSRFERMTIFLERIPRAVNILFKC